ncbi:hypothetical protein DFJ77DRAFT_237624 [Powellomyces hirtus]|nr:hypothetical protein DFJ77DRAFT_237624 [Powellomyces hirtus]
MPSPSKLNPGTTMVWTGLLHCGVGLAVTPLRTPLLATLSAGFFNAVDKYSVAGVPLYDRSAAFWFHVSGVLMALLGASMAHNAKETGTIPRSVGWGLLGLSAVGCVAMPASGFWLAAAQGVWVLTSWSKKTEHTD